jgi:hypothetical protein
VRTPSKSCSLLQCVKRRAQIGGPHPLQVVREPGLSHARSLSRRCPRATRIWILGRHDCVAWVGLVVRLGWVPEGATGCHPPEEPSLPSKANSDRRQHIPKQRFRATNWAEYEAALRGRGSLSVWFTDAAIMAWKAEPRTTRGGQPRYSALAINTALTLRAVFRLTLRQTEGLIGSIIAMLGFALAVPDHSTLSRRTETLEVLRSGPGTRPVHLIVDSTGLKLCGAGEWLFEKHGWSSHSVRSPRRRSPAS